MGPDVLKILSWRNLKNGKSKVTLTSSAPHTLLSWKQEISLSCERYHPSTRRKECILTTHDRKFGSEKLLQTNLVKLTLIFLVTSSPFTTPNQNPFVLTIHHKYIVSLSKRCKSFLLWSLLLVFILLWRLPCTCTNLIKFICFYSVNLSLLV